MKSSSAIGATAAVYASTLTASICTVVFTVFCAAWKLDLPLVPIEYDIERVATYTHRMPWTAIFVSPHSLNRKPLSNMTQHWMTVLRNPPDKVNKLTYAKLASLGFIAIRPPDQSEWDSVAEARATLLRLQKGQNDLVLTLDNNAEEIKKTRNVQFDRTGRDEMDQKKLDDLFKDEAKYLKTLTELTKARVNKGVVTIAMTPDSPDSDRKSDLDKIKEMVKSYFDDNGISDAVETLNVSNYEDVITGLLDGSIDFALCSPYSALLAQKGAALTNIKPLSSVGPMAYATKPLDKGNEIVLIKRRDGINLCDRDTSKHQIRFVYVSKFSTSGFLIPTLMMSGLGIHLSEVEFEELTGTIKNHQGAIDQVRKLTDGDNRHSVVIAGVPFDKLEKDMNKWRRRNRLWWYSAVGSVLGSAIVWFLRKKLFVARCAST